MYPPESEEGNVEYKLRINPRDLERLAGQLRRRMVEGGGEAVYVLGVSDDGRPLGLEEGELEEALGALRAMAQRIGASIYLLRTFEGLRGKIAEVLVRQEPLVEPPPTVIVTAMGNVDAGKSTLVGVLTTGRLDDGRGLARAFASRYRHEVVTGRTSSVSTRLLGFRGSEPVNHRLVDPLDEAEVYRSSDKVVLLVDVGGHERYLRTALRGFMGTQPDYVMLVVAANSGVQRMTREHLGYAVAMGIPVFVVVTRVDIAPRDVLERTMEEVSQLLKSPGVSKIPYPVRDLNDAVVAARVAAGGRVAPIFQVSSVTGVGLEALLRFLSLLPRRRQWDYSGDPLLYVSDIYTVRGVGAVVGGLLERGVIRVGDRVYLGPYEDGRWAQASVKSIHVNRVSVEAAKAGQYATFALDRAEGVEKGMVLSKRPLSAVRELEAEVLVLRHPTVIRPGFTGVLHYRSVRAPARVAEIDRGSLMAGERGRVRIALERPWHLEPGEFIFRNGPTRLFGRIVGS